MYLGERGDPINHGSSTATDALLEAVFENTPTAALITDDQRHYVAANKAACELLHLTLDELRLRRFGDFTPLSTSPANRRFGYTDRRAGADQNHLPSSIRAIRTTSHTAGASAATRTSPSQERQLAQARGLPRRDRRLDDEDA